MRGEKVKIPKRQCNIGVKLHNRFDIEVINDETGVVVQRAQAENVILDQAWEWIVGFKTTYSSSGYGWNYKVVIGTGTGTVSHTDINLFNQMGQAQAFYHHNNFDDKTNIYAYTTLATFSSSIAANQAITEVGIASENDVLMTHALIRDMTGKTISINKGSNETIKIYSTVFLHLSIPEGAFLVDTSNGSYTVGEYLLLDALVGRYSYSGIHSFNITEEEIYTHINSSVSTLQKFSSINPDTQKKTATLSFYRYSSSENNKAGGRRLFIILGSNYPVMYVYFDNDYEWKSRYYVNELIGTGDGNRTDFALNYLPYIEEPKIKVNGKTVKARTRNFNYIRTNDDILCYFKTVRVPKLPYVDNLNAVPLTKRNSSYILCQSTAFSSTGNTTSLTEEDAAVFENTLYSAVSIRTFSGADVSQVLSSNDMDIWTNFTKYGETFTISTAHQHDRYWKFLTSTNSATITLSYSGSIVSQYNVRMEEAPPIGSSIRAEYSTPVIPKDANHVMDFSLVFSFGEYKEAN